MSANRAFPALLLFVLLVGCGLEQFTGRTRQKAEDTVVVAPQATSVPAQVQPTPLERPEQPANDYPIAPATQPAQVLDNGTDQPVDLSSAPAPEAPLQDATEDEGSLFQLASTVFGVSLPVSSSELGLERCIGSSQFTVRDLPNPPDASSSEFFREIIISVSANGLLVNDYRVADVTCSESNKSDCWFGSGVERPKGQERGSADYLVGELFKQLNDVQIARSKYLRRITDSALNYLLTCDTYTLFVSSNIPYEMVARIVHTAARADLTKVRLAAMDMTDTLVYLPVVSPKYSGTTPAPFPIKGIENSSTPWASMPFAFEFVSVTASSFREDWTATPRTALVACFPEWDNWPGVLSNSRDNQSFEEEWKWWIDELCSTQPGIYGCVADAEGEEGGEEECGCECRPAADDSPKPAVSNRAASSTESPSGAPAGVKGADVPLASNAPKGAEGPKKTGKVGGKDNTNSKPTGKNPGVDASKDPDSGLPVGDCPEDLIPMVFLHGKEVTVLVRRQDWSVASMWTGPRESIAEGLALILPQVGRVLLVGAATGVSYQDLIWLLDTVRAGCITHTLSGRCREWSLRFPTIALFVSRDPEFTGPPPAIVDGPADANAIQKNATPHNR